MRFFTPSHSSANSGNFDCKSLKPSHTSGLFDKNGHPLPLLRLVTVAGHSKSKCFPVSGSSYGKIHHTVLLLFAVTSCGVRSPFFVGCHCFASSEFFVPRSLNPGHALGVSDKNGHPFPLLRFQILSGHSKSKCFPVSGSSYGKIHHKFDRIDRGRLLSASDVTLFFCDTHLSLCADSAKQVDEFFAEFIPAGQFAQPASHGIKITVSCELAAAKEHSCLGNSPCPAHVVGHLFHFR